MDKVVLVDGEAPNAAPPYEAMASAKYIIALSFIIQGGRTHPLWAGGVQITPNRFRVCTLGAGASPPSTRCVSNTEPTELDGGDRRRVPCRAAGFI